MVRLDANTHTYYVDDVVYPSVSSIIKRWQEPFDAEKMSSIVAKKKGLDQQAVLDEWDLIRDTAIVKGNACHDLGEQIAYLVSSGMPDVIAIVKFWADFYSEDLEIIMAEKPVFCAKYGFAGTPDLVAKKYSTIDGTPYNVMIDYKTNANIYKNYKGKRLLHPFDDMLDSPFSKYTIQQNLYKLALKENEIEIDEMYLVWTNEDEYDLVRVDEIEDLEDRISELIIN